MTPRQDWEHANQHIIDLTELVEDLAGNLEDAADALEKVTSAVWPGVQSNTIREYRRLVQKARDLLE